MRAFCTVLFLLLAPVFHCFSQNAVTDSLTMLLDKHPRHDEKRADLLTELAFNYYMSNPRKAVTFADEALEISKTKDLKRVTILKANLYKGYALAGLSEYKEANKNIESAAQIAQSEQNEALIADCQLGLGYIKMYQGNFSDALEKFQHAGNYFRRASESKKELIVNNNMASIYATTKNFEKAKEYFLKVAEGAAAAKDTSLLGVVFLNVGAVLCDEGKYDESISHLNQSVAFLYKRNNYSRMAQAYGNKGTAFSNLKQWDSAIYNIQKAIEINRALNVQRSIAIQSCNLADIYITTNQPEKAKPLLDSAYAIGTSSNIIDLQRIVLELKSDYFSKTGSADSALAYYKKSTAIKDSILGDEAQKKITKMELQYDFDRKADSLRFRNELTAIELQKQFLHSQKQKQELLLIEKDRQLQKLLSFQRLSALQAEQKEGNEKAKQLNIANKEKELQKARITALDKDNYLNKLRLRQQWFFSLGSIILLGGLGSFFIYRYNLKQTNLQAEIAKEKAEFESKVSNMALNSLRSQMNPHFIFNCLNSIRLFAAKNDSLSATNYISKFSRLMRLVLENSKSERISLQKEIETLQLYVDMELMRFKNKLKYDIHFRTGMDTEYIEVPPMLVQPYVENAIWHGLMHKEQGGKLEIDFTEEDETLIVKVRDNGIGRTKAAELKKQAPSHKSFAMNITHERLQLMNERYGTDASVNVIDLYENGAPSGTEVTIKIPIL